MLSVNITKEQKKRIARLLVGYSLVVVGVAIIYFLSTKGFRLFCIFNEITGLLCPGCGNTRAALSILRLDFASAFSYNPLCFLEFFFIGWTIIISSINYIKGNGFNYKSPCKIFDLIIMIIVLVWGIVRNIPGLI